MNKPFNIKSFPFPKPTWKCSSSDRLEDSGASFSFPLHFAATTDLQSSASSLPSSFDPGFDFSTSAASLPECIESPDSVVGPYDVMCGRDKHSFRNVGNRRFRITVSLFIGQYVEAETKSDKSRVIASVIETVKANGGRFLKWSSKRQEWVELDEKHTREKVGHALRDTAVAKMSQSVTGGSQKSKPSSSIASSASLSASVPPSAQSSWGSSLSQFNTEPRNAAMDGALSPVQVRSVQRLSSPTRWSAVSSLRHSLRASRHLTPDDISEMNALDQIADDLDGLFHRTSLISVSSFRGRDKHVRVGSSDIESLFLDVEEFEKVIVDEESSPTSRGLWDLLPED